ncbi:MAG: superoxide dismutase [Candidatus Micrarchaeota archaeon]
MTVVHEIGKLPYSYDALEPYIDAKTMEIHHTKHHQAYVTNLNTALDKHPELKNRTAEELLKDLNKVPEDIRTAVRNHGGGHANHAMFWKLMAPNAGGEPQGEVAEAIKEAFGGFDKFRESLTNAGMTRFGSGWAWLVFDKGKLAVMSTPNQDSPLSEGKAPILGVDVWEHAYYLKHMSNRAGYLKDWWNVVNWKEVGENYKNAMK